MARLRGSLLIDPAEEVTCFLRPGDTAAFISATGSIGITLVGGEEKVHTLSISYSALNDGDSETTGLFLDSLFQHLLPNWDNAPIWAKQSLGESWAATARSQQDPMVSVEEVVARANAEGVALATAGIPPDVGYYRVTGLTECQKVSEASRAKPRRSERIPEERNIEQTDASVRFAAPRPQPVDISETPILLGLTSANMASAPTSALPTLDEEGPFPGVEVDPSAWFDDQVIPSTRIAVARDLDEGWGYQDRFFYEVSSPLLKISDDENHLAMLVDTARARIELLWNSNKAYSWDSVSGVLLSSNIPETQTKPFFARVYPPVATLHGPVDVSTTPIYLGGVVAYAAGQPIEGPAPYSVSANNSSLRIEDGTGNYAIISVSNIIADMELLPSLDRHALTTEVYRFFLGKRLHTLVVSNLGVEHEEDGGTAINFMIAHLLAAKT